MSKQTDREKSIDNILKAAMTLFAKKGFKATTTDEIAKEANVSKGLIYFYFPSKDALLEKLIHSIFDEMPEEGLTELPPLEVIGQILQNFKVMLKNMEKWRLVTSILFQNSRKTVVKKLLKEKYLLYTQLLSLQFEKLGCKYPQQKAKELIAIMDGLALQSIFAADLVEANKIIDFIWNDYIKTYQS